MNTCRTQLRFTAATCLRHAGHEGEHEFPEVPEPKVKSSVKSSLEYRVARMLAIVLDEPEDNPDNPDAIRLEQARQLLMHWSSSQYAVTGMLRELVNLKRGYCVRCPEDPCPICGADSTKIEAL